MRGCVDECRVLRGIIIRFSREWIEAIEPLAYGLCDLSPDELWHLTPAELKAKVDAKLKIRKFDQEFQDMQNGVLCALIANVNRGADTDPFRPADFMITKQETEKEVDMTPEQIATKLKMIAASYRRK